VSNVVLHARSWEVAQRALDLITGLLEVMDKAIHFDPGWLVAVGDGTPDWMQSRTNPLAGGAVKLCGIPRACALAARASQRTRHTYAVAKLRFSLVTYSIHYMDLEPGKFPYLPKSPFPTAHVRYAYAIVAPFAAIEDLGFVPKKKTHKDLVWIPEVGEAFERRLKAAGVNVEDPVLWTLRGPERLTERVGVPAHGQAAPWNSGDVRDADRAVVDAIIRARDLRNRVVRTIPRRRCPHSLRTMFPMSST
jgi:hypothetical protein